MAVNRIEELARLGQSVWYDYIQRGMLLNDELYQLVDEESLRGITSNPTIFEKAIGGSTDYDESLKKLFVQGKTIPEIFDSLMIEDIQTACDIFRPVYDNTLGRDGFVSLEVSPKLAHDTQGTIQEATRLNVIVNRPNLMIKIPATIEGLPAITSVISSGINVNVTLLFSLERYIQVAEAYIKGLALLNAAGKPLNNIASVASFFVSRIDTLVDKLLDDKIKLMHYPMQKENLKKLQGNAAIAYAKMIYQKYKDIFQTPRFKVLSLKGAKTQRPLWASTGTKNPAYSDVLYVNELIGPDTVNTVPPKTWSAFVDHGTVASTVESNLGDAKTILTKVEEAGISLASVMQQLEAEGVRTFLDSYNMAIRTIAAKKLVLEEKLSCSISYELKEHAKKITEATAQFSKDNIAAKIWNKEASLWKKDLEHQKIIKNSLGWLTITEFIKEQIPYLYSFAEEVKKEGITDIVLMGMGGSSLAPKVLADLFPAKSGYPNLIVLDSTHPDAILNVEHNIKLPTTLFIVASKSGTTVEVLSYYKYFRDKINHIHPSNAGHYFIAITDPDTQLEKTALEEKFRHIFLNKPDIGGRYSALSYFGMVPAALLGINLQSFIAKSEQGMLSTLPSIPTDKNPGMVLGTILGELARDGRDKITIVTGQNLHSFGLWIEQLLAESTGKEGKGVVPVIEKTPLSPENYGHDRIFVYLELQNKLESNVAAKIKILKEAGFPIVVITIPEQLEIGREFFIWEFATAVLSFIIGVNPFDQPDVEGSKEKTKRFLAEYKNNNKLPDLLRIASSDLITLLESKEADIFKFHTSNDNMKDILKKFLALAQQGDYVALMSYLEPSEKIEEEINNISSYISRRWKVAVTQGFGPRFLHSTGQLHKGGMNTGLFIQITANCKTDIQIPNEGVSFGTLLEAQSLGDIEALIERRRRIIRINLGSEPVSGLEKLKTLLENLVPVKP